MVSYQCAVCTSSPGGFGWMEPPSPLSILHRRPHQGFTKNREQKRFCSLGCQSLFFNTYPGGVAMNREQLDLQAKHDALMALGDYVARIGMDKPLMDYSKEQAQGMVNCVLEAYQTSLKNYFSKEK